MNSGIVRNALTTTLALELGYREPPIFRETETGSVRLAELQHTERLAEDELTCPLSVI